MDDRSKKYWSTLAEYYNDPEVEKLRSEEFFSKPQEFLEQNHGPASFSRRDFMKLGSLAAMMSLIACGQRPVEKIVPYSQQPEEVVPGLANYYASTCSECPAACGIVAKTREGRPIKLEGNPDHPLNRGRLCTRGQASLFNLYDPDRLRYPLKTSPDGTQKQLSFDEIDAELVQKLKNIEGDLVVLTGTWHGPARSDLINRFLEQFPQSRHIRYEALCHDAFMQTRRDAFGDTAFPEYHIGRTNILVLLGADPFACGRNRLKYMREFAAKRLPGDERMSRVYAFEPAFSETGACGDYHWPVNPKDLYKIAGALANQIVIKDGHSAYINNDGVKSVLNQFEPAEVEKELYLEHGRLAKIARELWDNRGQGLILSESYSNQFEGAEKLHYLVHFLNIILENEGKTITAGSIPAARGASPAEDIMQFIADMKTGKVGAVLVYDTNPVYSMPEQAGFEDCFKNVPIRVSMADRIDETARLCNYLLPGLHGAESWGDAEPLTGLFNIQQPTISPLFDNRQFEDSLLNLGFKLGKADFGKDDKPLGFYAYLRRYWRESIFRQDRLAADFEAFWVDLLQKGFYASREYEQLQNQQAGEFNSSVLEGIGYDGSSPGGLVINLTVSSLRYDGRYQNNAWLLETPDPVTRITWDHYLAIAPSRASEMGLKDGDIVSFTHANQTFEIPVHLAPGTHKDVAALQVGWGRTSVGAVGDGLGINAFKLAGSDNGRPDNLLTGVKLEKTGKHRFLATVQGHNYIEGRPILFETTLDKYKHDHHAGLHTHHVPEGSLWKQDHSYPGHLWGMVIDLNRCIGCNSCIVACMTENNIPYVGREEVLNGREMNWLRIDRYFQGDPENPKIIRQPMTCHQCKKAPCETVCPVLATVHNDEGLNLQIYNRCVGTRYCSNNCPYKVRRFNYYDYHKNAHPDKVSHFALNPDVTVRTRGVMEKCTFCIQRIRDAHHKAKSEGRPVRDGEIIPACAQTCPGDAIVFGDLNDPDSRISRLARDPRAYRALEELNIEPQVAFLYLIRNRDAEETEEDGSHGH
jgi:molybdopterin-containing oxidoreductase family iron-sulfur binding subunit